MAKKRSTATGDNKQPKLVPGLTKKQLEQRKSRAKKSLQKRAEKRAAGKSMKIRVELGSRSQRKKAKDKGK